MAWNRRASMVGGFAAFCCSVALSLPATAWGQKAGWAVQADPPAAAVEWPATLSLNIAQPPQQEELLFPRQNSAFCVVGLAAYESNKAELWNLATGKRVGAIQGNPSQSNMKAVSPDGKYLALAVLDRARANDVEVWSLETGKRVAQFQADDRNLSMTLLDFAGPGEVLVYTFGQSNGKFVYHLRVWDAKTGMSTRQMDLDKNISGNNRYDISPGNRWLATIISSDIVFYDLQTGKVKGSLTPPKQTAEGKYVSTESVRFSPDGSEIAVLSQGSQGDILVVYDVASGDEKLRHELTPAMKSGLQHPASYKGPAIDYVMQPAGFLWYGGAYLERETGLMLWTYKQGILEFSHWKRFLTPAGLIVSTGGSNARKIQVLDFPAAAMEKTLEAYRNDAPAIIKPGEKVQVKVVVGEVRHGKPDEAKKSIEEVLASRLADDGLEVDPAGGTVLTLKYKEMAGKVLQEVKGGNIFGGGTPTGRTVQSTAGEVEIVWTTKDAKTKLYEHKFNLDPSHLILRDKAPPTDATVRQQVFEILKLQLAGLPMPYFVPTDKSLITLPTTTLSSTAAPTSPQDAIKKKIEAKKKLGKK
jgi:hypothetical protein